MSIEKGYEGGYRETWRNDGFVNTLASADGGNATRQKHLIAQPGGPSPLRTLTVTEWERLSGFPDGWTDTMSMSERFAACGDTFHVGTSEWLGRRLLAVHQGLDAHPTLFADQRDRTPVEVGDQLALFA